MKIEMIGIQTSFMLKPNDLFPRLETRLISCACAVPSPPRSARWLLRHAGFPLFTRPLQASRQETDQLFLNSLSVGHST